MTEVRTVSQTGGEKGDKPERYDLIPVEPLAEVARHYGVGARKYEDRNWERGYPWHLSYAALQRHANAFWNGEEIDGETGTPHLAAVVFHAFTLMEFAAHHREYDDRSTLGRGVDLTPEITGDDVLTLGPNLQPVCGCGHERDWHSMNGINGDGSPSYGGCVRCNCRKYIK